MQIINDIIDWKRARNALSGATLGFVPTMGNLHHGHASLVKASLQENASTVVSIFINPAQFHQRDDFTHYPRTIDADLKLLTDLGVDFCLLPDEKALYPQGYRYQLHENMLSLAMEGAQRPGHFDGVLTVVMKLFNIVRPQRAYFGVKDYQQLQLIRGMTTDFFIDLEIKSCPTIREASGLAYSSRNTRLSIEQRALADEFARIFHQVSKTSQQLHNDLKKAGIDVNYIEEQDNRRFIAVQIGGVRLIDNYEIPALEPSLT